MKAVLLAKHGKAERLRVSEIPTPQPEANQVRVKIQTCGINYAEILSRKGLYGWAPKLPYVPGMEAYGEIDAVGHGVEQRQVGEQVIVGTQHGSYAEYIVVPEPQARPALNSYSPDENAAFAVNYMTAWVCLIKLARLRPSDRVLIQAAGGGVGTAAVQIARQFGCTVYGTAGNDDKIERLYKLNINHAINYRKQDFEQEFRKLTNGEGVDVVLELVGGEVYRKSLNLLAPFGRLVVAGFASLALQKWNPISWWKTWRDIPRANVGHMAVNSYGVLASHLGYQLKDTPRLLNTWQELTDFVHKHQIRPVVGATFSFDDIASAHKLMESRQSYGKIVVSHRQTLSPGQ
jgi:NADPH2:quinone reductase